MYPRYRHQMDVAVTVRVKTEEAYLSLVLRIRMMYYGILMERQDKKDGVAQMESLLVIEITIILARVIMNFHMTIYGKGVEGGPLFQ